MAILLAIGKFLLPFVAGAVSHAWHRAHSKEREYVASKIQNERLRSIFLRLDQVIDVTVKELMQTAREGLELAADGQLSQEARRALLNAAVRKVCEYMSNHGLEELAEVLRLSEEVLLKFIESKIEAKVHDVHRVERAIASPNISTSIRLPAPSLD